MNSAASFSSAPLVITLSRFGRVLASSGSCSSASTCRKVFPSPCGQTGTALNTRAAASKTLQLQYRLISLPAPLAPSFLASLPNVQTSAALLTPNSFLQPYHNTLYCFLLTPQSANCTILANNSVWAAHGSFCRTNPTCAP